MTDSQSITPIIFVEIPGAEGYEAGSDGHIYSRRTPGHRNVRQARHQLREKIDKDGYREISIYDGFSRRSFKVHQLILLAFHGPCPPAMMACHFPDYDRSNNRPENLMWGTNSTNQLHRRVQGTAFSGAKNHKAKFSNEEMEEIRRTYEAGEATQKQLAQKLGVHVSTIHRMIHGLTWGGIKERKSYVSRRGGRRSD